MATHVWRYRWTLQHTTHKRLETRHNTHGTPPRTIVYSKYLWTLPKKGSIRIAIVDWTRSETNILFAFLLGSISVHAEQAHSYACPGPQTFSNSFLLNASLDLFRRHTASYPKLQGLIRVGFGGGLDTGLFQLPRNTHAATATNDDLGRSAQRILNHPTAIHTNPATHPVCKPSQKLSPLFFLFLGTFSYF